MRKRSPLVAICLGSFMLLIDVTIVNVALPDVAGDLSTSFSSLQWVIDGYALALAALLLALCLFGLAIACLTAFVVIDNRRRLPLLDLRLFRHRTFVGTVLAAFVLSFSAFAALPYTTVWTQSLLGLSPIASGPINLPLPVLSAILSATSGRFMHQLPRPLVIGGGVILIGVGGLLFAVLVTSDAGWTALLPGLAVISIGCGVSVPTLSATATTAVGDKRAGMASGAINTGGELGQALGIALGVPHCPELESLVAATAKSSLRGSQIHDPSGVARELVGGQAQSTLRAARPHPGPLDDTFHSAFAPGLGVAFFVARLAAVITGNACPLPRSRPPAPAGPEITNVTGDTASAHPAQRSGTKHLRPVGLPPPPRTVWPQRFDADTTPQ